MKSNKNENNQKTVIMKAIEFLKYGDVENLVLKNVEKPIKNIMKSL